MTAGQSQPAGLGKTGIAVSVTFLVIVGLVLYFSFGTRSRGPSSITNQASNCLRELAIATLEHEDAIVANPAAVPAFDETKLSWRVKLLPYLEQQEFFEEFHLDEPWDSPHNASLIERMPKVFQSPVYELPPGMTCFVRPVEASGSFERRGQFSRQQRENLAWLLEVPPELATTWTKPDHLSIADPRIKAFRSRLIFARLNALIGILKAEEVTPERLEELFTPPPDSEEK